MRPCSMRSRCSIWTSARALAAREVIVTEIVGGYRKPCPVPMARSSPLYDQALLKPIACELNLARQYMTKAGYVY